MIILTKIKQEEGIAPKYKLVIKARNGVKLAESKLFRDKTEAKQAMASLVEAVQFYREA